MAYIGNIPAESYASFETETFTVSATANYTLSHAVTNEDEIRLVINGVVQQPGSGKAYTASGTTLTLSSATASGDVMYAVYLGRALQTVNPPNASVGISQLSATGTKDATTFLRGDNSFAAPGAGMTLINATSGSSNVTSITVDNVFTSTYDFYKIFMSFRVSNDAGYYFRYIKADGTDRTSDYINLDGRLIQNGTFEDNGSGGPVSTFYFGRNSGSDISSLQSSHEFTVFNPFLSSTQSTITNNGVGYHDSVNNYLKIIQANINTNVESHRGFKIVANSGNFNPYSIKVFGVTNV